MTTTMRQEKQLVISPGMVACGMVLGMLSGMPAVAQQVAKGAVAAPQAAVAEPAANSFATVPFGSLLPGAAPPKPAAQPVQREEAEAGAPKKVGAEGVKVHGHWVIDVRNPDGTLVEHRDFQNSLTTGGGRPGHAFVTGDQILEGLLSGSIAVGDPAIVFNQDPTPQDPWIECANGYSSGSFLNCYLFTTSQSLVASAVVAFGTTVTPGLSLTVNFGSTASSNANWVLTGNYTVPVGLTSIVSVGTVEGFCLTNTNLLQNPSAPGSSTDRSSTYSSSSCSYSNGSLLPANEGYGSLTATIVSANGVATPLNVALGQVLTVTVTISFS
jgi:hypothetical protein